MQDENASKHSRKLKLLTALPAPVLQLLQQSTPQPNYTFKNEEYVAVMAHGGGGEFPCGCVAVRKLKTTSRSRLVMNDQDACTYKCPMCDASSRKEQKHLLDVLKHLLEQLAHRVWVFVEFPLQDPCNMKAAQIASKAKSQGKAQHPKKADVVVVPEDARSVQQVLVIELDGSSHSTKPFCYGMTGEEGREANRHAEARKNRICSWLGLDVFRLSKSDIATLQQLEKILIGKQMSK
jgi:hypothetical protein